MISDEEIIWALKEKKLFPPDSIRKSGSILIKSLWALKICKDNSIASSLSPECISKIAHHILDEDIERNSVSKAFSRAGKRIKRLGDGFYEIMGVGHEELKNFEESFEREHNFKERFYDSGDQFDFYQDIKKIMSEAKKSVFIVDSYVDEDLFENYIEKIKIGIDIKILTNSRNPKGNFVKIAKMFAKKKGVKFGAKESLECHDRIVFIDNNGWIIGQSIKDNAKNKPAYMIKLINPDKLEKIHQRVWNFATKIV